MFTAAKKLELCLGQIQKTAQKLDSVVDLPEDEDKQLVFVLNFIDSAVNDKITELSQSEN